MFEENKKKEVSHIVGQDINSLSVSELEERILLVQEELKRLENTLVSKKSFLSSAEDLFKK